MPLPLALSRSACALALFATGCSLAGPPGHVRGSDAPGIDEPAMGTDLDRRDLNDVFVDAQVQLLRSSFFKRAAATRQRKTLGTLPLRNETSEHIDQELDILLSKMETDLVGRDVFLVVAHDQQGAMIEEVRRQAGAPDVFDPRHAAQLGRQLGVAYLLTGKVMDHVDRTDSTRRVQYFVFLQVVEVETSRIVWASENAVTKALVSQHRPGKLTSRASPPC